MEIVNCGLIITPTKFLDPFFDGNKKLLLDSENNIGFKIEFNKYMYMGVHDNDFIQIWYGNYKKFHSNEKLIYRYALRDLLPGNTRLEYFVVGRDDGCSIGIEIGDPVWTTHREKIPDMPLNVEVELDKRRMKISAEINNIDNAFKMISLEKMFDNLNTKKKHFKCAKPGNYTFVDKRSVTTTHYQIFKNTTSYNLAIDRINKTRQEFGMPTNVACVTEKRFIDILSQQKISEDFHVRNVTIQYILCDFIDSLNKYQVYLETCLNNLARNPIYLADNVAFGDISPEYIRDISNNKRFVEIISIKCNGGYGFVQKGNICYQADRFRLCKNDKGRWNIMFENACDEKYLPTDKVDDYFEFLTFINKLDRETDEIVADNVNPVNI